MIFEIFTKVSLNIPVFYNNSRIIYVITETQFDPVLFDFVTSTTRKGVTSCGDPYIYRPFERTFCLHIQGKKTNNQWWGWRQRVLPKCDIRNFTLYVPCIVLQCVDEHSYNHVAVRLACTNVPNTWYSLLDGAPDDGQPSPSYNHVAVRLACTNVPNAWYSLLDGAPDDGQIVRPKHVGQNKEK